MESYIYHHISAVHISAHPVKGMTSRCLNFLAEEETTGIEKGKGADACNLIIVEVLYGGKSYTPVFSTCFRPLKPISRFLVSNISEELVTFQPVFLTFLLSYIFHFNIISTHIFRKREHFFR